LSGSSATTVSHFHGRLLIAMGLAAAISGCGVSVGVGGWEEDAGTAEAAPRPGERLVVIDWEAGPSRMRGGAALTPVDLSAFDVADGSTLADEPAFVTLVEQRMQTIFADLEPANVRVMTAEADDYPEATVVLMTFEADADDPRRVGQAYYDPCDTEPADEAIVWGSAIVALGNGHRLDEWVNLFANVAAHEVAHTLGFAHPEVAADSPLQPDSTALMLASHTLSALLQDQTFQIPQSTCPGALADGADALAGYRVPDTDTHSQWAAAGRPIDSLAGGFAVDCPGW